MDFERLTRLFGRKVSVKESTEITPVASVPPSKETDSNALLADLAAQQPDAGGLQLIALLDLAARLKQDGMEQPNAAMLAALFTGNICMEGFAIGVPSKQSLYFSIETAIENLPNTDNDLMKKIKETMAESITLSDGFRNSSKSLASLIIARLLVFPIGDIIPLQWLLACMGHRSSTFGIARLLRRRAAMLIETVSNGQPLPGPLKIADIMLLEATQWEKLARATIVINFVNRLSAIDNTNELIADTSEVEFMRCSLMAESYWGYNGSLEPVNKPLSYWDDKKRHGEFLISLSIPDLAPHSPSGGLLNLIANNAIAALPPPPRVVVAELKQGGHKGFSVLSTGVRVFPARSPGDEIWGEMQARFPWCAAANSILAGFAEVARRGSSTCGMHIPPLLLVGPPGCGKTRWARAAAEAVGVPFHSVSFAGANTSVLVNGTEQGWSSAHPGLVATAMRNLDCANPMVLVDEVDKTGESHRNGSPIEALLPLLERETAARFPDACLLVPLDSSRVSWVLTANSFDRLPGPLLSRVRIIEMSSPPAAMLAGVLESMREDIASEWGIDKEAIPEIGTGDLKEAMRAYASTPDLRPLRRRVASSVRRGIWSPPEAALRH